MRAISSSLWSVARLTRTPPTLTGEGFDGEPVTIEPGGGTPMVVVFAAHWCPHCQAEIPIIQDWIDEGNLPEDVQVNLVSTGVQADQNNYPPSEWLAQEGLTNDEINTVELTVVPPVNTEQALRAGQIAVASLNGIHRESALERGGIRPLFTDKSLFGAFSYGTYVLRDDFIAQNPEVTEDFVQGTARAIRWTQVTPRDEVVDRFREIITSRGRNENTKTIEYWRSPGIPVPGAVIADRELRTWIDWLVRNGELEPGRLTAEDLYTNKFNPYANGTYSAGSGPDGEAVGTK